MTPTEPNRSTDGLDILREALATHERAPRAEISDVLDAFLRDRGAELAADDLAAGRALARALADEGAPPLALVDQVAGAVAQMTSLLEAHGGPALCDDLSTGCDVSPAQE